MSANVSGILKPPFVIPEIQGWQGYTVLGLIGFMLIALVAELAPPYLVMMGTLIIFLALSILDVSAAFHGFADEAMLAVAVLYIVARGLEQSGGLEYVASVLFRTPDKTKELLPGLRPSKTKGSIVWVLLKFTVPVAIFSAFLANIPLVAMMIPPIVEFGNKVNLPPSKMLLPLSYAAQLGGTMTLIGASTNLVVLSMAAQKLPDLKMNLFEIGIIGVPVTIAGIFYIIAFSGKLLPDRLALQPTTINAREYNVALIMKPTSRLARKSIEKSGINRQPGLTLSSIDRDGTEITHPTPDIVLQPKDRLHFVGVVDSVLFLAQLNGLVLTEDEGQEQVDLNRLKTTQCLVEAVVASESPMVHKRIADLQFRERYKAAVVAIHRYGKRLSSAIGEIKVEAGDCLLLVVDGPEFVNKHRNNSTFALVAQLPGFKPLNRRKAAIAAVLVLALVVASGMGVKLITAALFTAAGLLITKCLSPSDAVESIQLPVLIMIAAAFGIAEAMVESGAATMLAKALMGLAGKSMFGLVTCTYVATTFFSLAITNSAAVTIMFPVALAAANQQMLDFRPFAYILMMAASACFMTPTGCPTNLMVYTPGGYKFSDFIYYGGPLQILLLIVTVGISMTSKYWFIWWIFITLITLISIPLIARHKSTHPKPMPAPGPTSSPEDMKPSLSESDTENPKAPLTPGNADSSSFDLSFTSFAGSSNSKPGFLQLSSPGASASPVRVVGSEDLSTRTSGSSPLLMGLPSTSTKELPSIVPTSQEFPASEATSSTSSFLPTTKPLLDFASSIPLSHFNTDIVLKPDAEPTREPLPTFPVPAPSHRAPVSTPPVTRPSPWPTPDTSWAKSPLQIPETPSSKPTTVTSQITPPGLVTSIPSTTGPKKLLFKPASLQTEITPSPGPVASYIPSPPRSGPYQTGTVSQPIHISESPNPTSRSIPSSTPATLGTEPFPSPPPKSTSSTSGFGHASKLVTSPIQKGLPFVPVSKLTPGQGTAEPGNASFLSYGSTPGPGPSFTRTASLPAHISLSPGTNSTPMLFPSQTPAASPVRMEPSPGSLAMPLDPVSKPAPPIPREGTEVAGGTSLLCVDSPPTTALAFPFVSFPGSGTAAAKRASIPPEETPFVSVTLAIPNIPGLGTAPTMRASLVPPERSPPIPVALLIPLLPTPAEVAKRASLIPPEPSPIIPAPVPIPILPGPGTAAAKRASLTPQRKPFCIASATTKRPSLLGPERPPHATQPARSTSAPIHDANTTVVNAPSVPLTDNESRRSSTTPIVVRTYIPTRAIDLPLPTGSSISNLNNAGSSANVEALESGTGNTTSLTTEPPKPAPLFFTTQAPPDKKGSRRLTPPPWAPSAHLSPPIGDPNKRTPSRTVEEDLTGGISELMIPRRLSSINDTEAFADRWHGTMT